MHFPPRHALTRAVPAAYVTLIERMRFHIEPDISCSRFFGTACFTPESIAAYRATGDGHALKRTEMGEFIGRHLQGGLFIDVPCGLHDAREQNVDFSMLPLAAALGVTDIWEIDLTADVVRDRVRRTIDVIGDKGYALTNGIAETSPRTEGSLFVATMQDDVLGLIAKIDPARIDAPKAIYVSALQPDETLCANPDHQQAIAVPYLTALYDELSRASTPGDLVMLNSSAMLVTGIDESLHANMHPALALPPRGFSLMRRCALDKVHVFLRD